MNSFSWIFIAALAASVVLKLWLAQRQIQHVSANRARVPDAFADRITLADHQKAADYTTTNTRFGRLDLVYDSLLLLGWTLGAVPHFRH
jgi:STE24 endopeptidase